LEEKGAGANVSHSNELIDAVGVSGFCPASASLYWSVIVHAHMDVEIKRKISSLSLSSSCLPDERGFSSGKILERGETRRNKEPQKRKAFHLDLIQ
jgi:hypothetical protein